MAEKLQIAKLAVVHDPTSFDCGSEALNRFIKLYALRCRNRKRSDRERPRAWLFAAFLPSPSVEDGGLVQKPLHPLVAARGRIKRRHERSPLLGIQTDAIAFRQYLVRRGEGAVDDELA